MRFTITREQMLAFDPNLSKLNGLDQLIESINTVMDKYEINTTARRIRYFISQTAFETNGYKKFTEDLYYVNPSRLQQVWPSRFYYISGGKKIGNGKANAADYVRNPQKLANSVYAGRMGNGPESSGDGWKFIGRGGIHLTGRNNYTVFSRHWFGDDRLLDDPDMILDDDYLLAMATAGYYWHVNNLNQRADRDEFTLTTRDIQGSTATVSARLPYLRRANQAFVF